MRRVNVKDLPADPEGDARRFAEIVASRKFPGLATDCERFKGIASGHHTYDGIHPLNREFYRQKALAAGVNPDGKKYLSSLATEPGDPRAWVDSTSDIRKTCEANDWSCEGIVSVKSRDKGVVDDEGPYQVSEKIVEQVFTEKVTANPEIAPTPKEKVALKESLRESLSGR